MSYLIDAPPTDPALRLDPRSLDARTASERISWRDAQVRADPATPGLTIRLDGRPGRR